ncbi:MAG: hypothetical protein NT131_02905 [Methanomassiliicoccales archaeon]|nr:hypothetical protein [Methanomassiliicoccales archaeon]
MKKGLVLGAIAVIVVVMLLALFLLGGIAQDPQGFTENDLNAPAVTVIVRDEDLPGPLSGMDFPAHLTPWISYTPMFEEFGGVVELLIENNGINDLYVRSYSVTWEGGNATFSVNCSKLVGSGDTAGMGELYLAGPGINGTVSFLISMDLWVSSNDGSLWYNKGELPVESIAINVLPEEDLQGRDVEKNPIGYYNKVNELINFEAVQVLADLVLTAAPGNFSVLQIIKAFELVSSTITYAEDEDNHWQSASETIALGTGDCEDQAILLASLVTVLGGDCRVNLITGHAFPTVYIGNNTSDMQEVKGNIQDYYGNEVPVHWMEDELGFWLVIDTVGMPYVGGYPAASVPVGDGGGENWNFEDGDWVRTIDVTGETVEGLTF